ncbi:MAG: response regulator [Granulosicoccus sp.]|nr:response regulator [Granulosicoccus sp.]
MTPRSRLSDRVSEQLLQICSRNSARAAIPLMLAILLTWLLLANKVDERLLQLWALSSCTVILLRVVLLRYISRRDDLSALQKRMTATALTLALGCTIGSVLYFFQGVGTFERAMLTAILLGLCTASHSTNFGYRPLLLSYIGPLLGTLALLWIANPDQLLHPALAVSVGISILIVAQTLLMNGKFMFDAFALSIEASQKLEEQSRHLAEALAVSERAQSEAEASSQSKTRFLAAASHDLRQPVHVLNLFGAALRKADLDARSRDIVDNMNVAVTSLSSQLNALLDMSELDCGAVKPHIRSVDLSRLTGSLKLEMEELAEDKGIRLNCNIPDGLFVRTDPAMFSQIIRNLCGNAIKYTFAGHVSIQVESDDRRVCLTIVDTGIGIDDSEQGQVFEEFYQVANPGRDKGQGMGLGLSIVERLIRLLGHTLEFSSQVGVGTTVTIGLDRCTREQVSSAFTPCTSEPVEVCLPANLRVHLVDDEDAVRRSVETFLATLGCAVTATASSQATIEFLGHNDPAVVLIDLRLQGDDSGLVAVDWIRRERPDLPIALVTGESLSDGEVARRYPDLLMLQKPVSREALLELLAYMVPDAPGKSPENSGELVREGPP